MEKIKSLLSGSSDDNVAASNQGATGQSSAPHSGTTTHQTGGLSGEGSHLATARENVAAEKSAGLAPTSSGIGNTQTTGASSEPALHGTTSSGIGNTQTTGLSSERNPQNTTSSGFGNTQTTGISSGTTTAGPHDSNLANKLDPRFDSEAGVPRTAGGGVANSSYGAHDPTTGAARDGAVGDGLAEHEYRQHQNQGTTGIGGTTGTRDFDPSTGHNTTGGSTGRDAALGASGAGLAEHEHHKHHKDHQTGIGGATGRDYDQSTGTHNTSHSAGRDAAIGASGAGLAEHEHHKHHGQHQGQHQTGIGGSTRTGDYDQSTGYNTTGGSTGRDAALGASGAGLAEHEHHKHHKDHQTGIGGATGRDYDQSTGTHNTSHSVGRDAALGASGAGLAEHEHHKHHDQHQTGIGGSTGTRDFDPSTGHNTTGGSTGRDAALGASGAGLGEHEHHKHHDQHQTGIGVLLEQETMINRRGPTTLVTLGVMLLLEHLEPAWQNTSIINITKTTKLVSVVPRERETMINRRGLIALLTLGVILLLEHQEPAWQNTKHHKHHKDHQTGISGSTGTRDHDQSTGTHSTSHTGRDAAIGASGAGLAEHEHRKHDSERDSRLGGSTGHSTGAYDNTSGTSTSGTSHVGRDAGIGAAGVGAAGVAEHEHHKHQQGDTSDLPGPAPNTAGPHKKDWMNKLDPRVDANPNKSKSTDHDATTTGASGGLGNHEAGKLHGTGSATRDTPATTAGPHSSDLANKADPSVDSDRSKDHHYARDGAVAGGVGTAAYEADKHHKHDKDLTAAEREEKKEHKRELKEEKREEKERKHELKEEKHDRKDSKGGLLSFLHRDKNKKYTPEEEAEFDRQEREHKGRDALGGAAAGGAAYEAEKHHRDHKHAEGDTNKALPTAPGNHGIGTGAGTGNALAGDNTASTSSGHNLGRAEPLAGGVGAAGAHDHSAHSRTSGSTPLADKPVGTDLGDKLHGVERNRGVAGSSGFPGNEGFGTGATSSAGIGSSTTTGHDSHAKRDAGVGAVGAAGLAEHEHRKHEGISGGHHDHTTPTTSGLTGSHQGVGGSGYRKDGLAGEQYGSGQQSGLSGQQSGLPYQQSGHSHQQSGLTGQHNSGITGTGSNYDPNLTSSNTADPGNSTDRNRLHKDPPANHPAAQGGVPASSTERERLVGQGEQRIDQDTGVAHAHGQGGNAASNY